ncbi:type I-F CRISPR-associated helicase Cas3f [Azotobacter chroococcum]|jgi:CRISPR-associated endonuclease/helicase Cas3|uniref:CRISPR-associated endonuclease/helicase Cas3 n=1 Tax=Azotobacter chroococcum TaxID=353 RepID=A0A4R1PNE2_9GAMM|nr:type I-F CRISPR-associated helicase Cas3f [Azotobacter chroococcum]TBV91757.1 type I-F CRISPR-associated helicase Cas3 [Azotobacter chroococcum]TCL32868.1 CRISPR-associated endonuclease/helicase Cas3 [Azotobacter chroococcum]
MNILLICECSKRALSETRRILDQFAERRGERTWQTPITQQGLDTLHRLLRKTARRNTAVACHWIRGKDHSELLWVVGDASRFNAQGAVPTNSTARNVLRREDENDWHTAEDIRLLAQLAALLHDLGKASIAFQGRLRGKLLERNLYRHEWVSLRLFLAFVGEDDDEGWLRRLADPGAFDERLWLAPDRYRRDGLDAADAYPFRDLPPLAAAVAWLVVTHHRLPVAPVVNEDGTQAWLGKRRSDLKKAWLETPLAQVAHDWNEIRQPAEHTRIEPYWKPAGPLPVAEPKWRSQASRLARRLLELRPRRDGDWLGNPYAMHLARLSLMLADHYYSSLPKDSPQRLRGDGNTRLYANTDRDGSLKQPLDEHLLGVARDAGLIAHALPGFERYLPRLANHRGLRKRSANPRFSWQDKAADAAVSLREAAREHGAFIVNMASTGCGKTLANARILYALADPRQGLRATYALGLRTLTLQTGRSYRSDLHLGEDELAIRVGGSASRALFEYYKQKAEAHGSASVQDLIEEDSHVLYEGVVADHPLLSRALHDADIRNLLSAPMLVCTVDHLVPATEALRAGRQIAPMLRLMSADLVLDELDDYDLDDLPALTRLVHWAGMLGTRVVLSSATLPPALVEGMFMAYRAGRIQYRHNRGIDGGQRAEQVEIPCLWADEFGAQTATCTDAATFAVQHMQFVGKRAAKLEKAEPLRRAELVPLDIAKNLPNAKTRAEFARHVRDACLRLHGDHAETDPASGKHVSFGIVRMANIDPLFDVAQALFALGAPEDTRIHLCVYHARFPLVQRSAIEYQLDSALNRRGDGKDVYRLPAIRAVLDAHPEPNQLFVVLASPVCEVGRDWDADWAVAEPSSMRSLIQLAGRVQRHRSKRGEKSNMLIFDTNLRHFLPTKGPDDRPAAIFVRPGFEKERAAADHPFRLIAHRLGKLMAPEEYRTLTALPRIRPRARDDWRPKQRLVDLEQARMADCMLPSAEDAEGERGVLNAASGWQQPQAALTGVLPQQQPFRDDAMPTTTLVFLPDEDEEHLVLHRVEDDKARRGQNLYVPIDRSQRHPVPLELGERIGTWGEFDLMGLLAEQAEYLDLPLHACAERLAMVEVPASTQGWRYHPWLGFAK